MKSSHRFAFATPFLLFACLAHGQVAFSFDYTYDSGGFFTGANAGRQTYLIAAGNYVAGFLNSTSLSAITPTGANTWTAQPSDPRDINAWLSLTNLTIPANTIVVYVGAYDLPHSTLGVGGPGGWGGSGTQAWLDAVDYRGNGTFSMPATGSITFDSAASWYFDNDITTTEAGAMAGKSDFFSVATHELVHLLGFGTSSSWSSRVSAGTFTGSASSALTGGSVILSADQGHWAENTMGLTAGSGLSQETAMDPTLTQGTRKYLTTLDVAGLSDIGYSTSAIPEPSTYALWCALGVFGWCWWRRRSA